MSSPVPMYSSWFTSTFLYEQFPIRVVFERGALCRLPGELQFLGGQKTFLLCTPGQKSKLESAAQSLGTRVAGVFTEALMHVPVEMARIVRQEVRRLQADSLLAVGGGSAIGLAKAVALELELPIIAVPTTFSGSEMTPTYAFTESGRRRTGRDPRVLPRTVLYDPLLALSLPPRAAGASGMNAIAHCVEALYTQNPNPITCAIAEEAIRILAASLPKIAASPGDVEPRAEALCAAFLAGTCLGTVAMALHHKLCHVLGGSFNLPHAGTHAVVLPYAVAYNAPAARPAMARIAAALGADDAVGGLLNLAERIGAPRSLREIGMRESDLDRAAELATQDSYYNPRPLDGLGIRQLLANAFYGRRP